MENTCAEDEKNAALGNENSLPDYEKSSISFLFNCIMVS